MATLAKRDMIMFTFVHTESIEFQTKAFEIAKNIILNKVFCTPFDLIQFCKWTDTLSPCYDEFKQVSLESIEELNEFILNSKVYSENPVECHWIKALHTSIKYALHNLENSSISHNSFQIVLFTSLSTDAANFNLIKKCISNVDQQETVCCYILGPELEIPLSIKKAEDMFEILKKDCSLEERYGRRAEPLLQFIRNTRSITCALEPGQHLVEACKPAVRSILEWKVEFTIGDRISIPVVGIRYVKDSIKTSFKISKEDESVTENDEDPTSDGSELDIDDIFNGETSKSLTKEEKLAHKMVTLRCLDLLFVTKASNMNELYNMGETFYMLFGQESHLMFFTAFVQALHKSESIGLARKCYNRGNHPKLVALIPRLDTEQCCLQIMELPFSSDVTNPVKFLFPENLWKITNIPKVKYPELKEPVNNYLDALCLDKDKPFVDTKTFLPTNLTLNPYFETFYEVIRQKVLDPEFNVNSVTPKVPNFLSHVSPLAGDLEKARQDIFG